MPSNKELSAALDIEGTVPIHSVQLDAMVKKNHIHTITKKNTQQPFLDSVPSTPYVLLVKQHKQEPTFQQRAGAVFDTRPVRNRRFSFTMKGSCVLAGPCMNLPVGAALTS